MSQQSLRAVFMRGGTSKALFFRASDLPEDQTEWDAIFLAAMGTPDPYGRQLNGMGGGVTSLSKVAVIGPSTREDADVDYTFAQVLIKERRVTYGGNCGNISAAVGPFVVDEKLLEVGDGTVTVRIHNTNTKKVIHATFEVENGLAVTQGEALIPGVSGTGAPIRLDFLDPAGAMTGTLLPTRKVAEFIELDGYGPVEISVVDAGNPCVFVSAASLGLTATEAPEALERQPELLRTFALIGHHALVRVGFAKTVEEAAANKVLPLIVLVAAPTDSTTLAGEHLAASAADLQVRVISSGQPHRASPLTGALCTAVAAAMTGTVANRLVTASGPSLRLATPSGVLVVSADVSATDTGWTVPSASFYRTARRLFDGKVYWQ